MGEDMNNKKLPKSIERFWNEINSRPDGPYFKIPIHVYSPNNWKIETELGYIFDDPFWDVFHKYDFHVCHVVQLSSGEYDLRFRLK